MKKIKLFILLAILGLFSVQCDKTPSIKPKLNQTELMKKFIGLWYTEGTYLSGEIRPFGLNGFEGYQKAEFNDSVGSYHQIIYGYDEKNDRYISAGISKNQTGIFLLAFKFVNENKCERTILENMDKAGQSSFALFEFKSPDLIFATFKDNNNPDRTYKIIRRRNPI